MHHNVAHFVHDRRVKMMRSVQVNARPILSYPRFFPKVFPRLVARFASFQQHFDAPATPHRLGVQLLHFAAPRKHANHMRFVERPS
jgi:hypothetical protein